MTTDLLQLAAQLAPLVDAVGESATRRAFRAAIGIVADLAPLRAEAEAKVKGRMGQRRPEDRVPPEPPGPPVQPLRGPQP